MSVGVANRTALLRNPEPVGLDAGVAPGGPPLLLPEQLGLLCEPAESLPPMAEFWPVEDLHGAIIGLVRWAAYSYALERPAAIALLDGRHEAGEQVLIHHGTGTAQAEVANLPFVS